MFNRVKASTIATLALGAAIFGAAAHAQAPAQRNPNIPRMKDGKPNLTGLWQALGTAYWGIRDHSAGPSPDFQLGTIAASPAGTGIVEGGEIPYKPDAAAIQQENFKNRPQLDPEVKC